MKVNPMMTVFSVAISALLTYIVYSVCDGENWLLLSILSGVSFLIILFSGIGLKYSPDNANANIKILATVFAVVSFAVNITLALTPASQTVIIIVTSVLMLTYLLILYLLPKSGI